MSIQVALHHRTTYGLAFAFTSVGALLGCDSSVVGGGGGGGGAGGGAVVVASSGAEGPTTAASATTDAGSGPGASSVGSGDVPQEPQGVVVPRDDDEVWLLLASSPQSCAAPLSEPACGPGDSWLAWIDIPRRDLTPGTYELGGAEIGISVAESFDDCMGGGGRGWDGEPAWLTVESIDASHAVITIDGAYDDVDGTWDVPLCAGVTPA